MVSGNAALKSELSELESRLNIVEKDKDRLVNALNSRTVQHINYTVPDPSHIGLRQNLEGELAENHRLIATANAHGETAHLTVEPQGVNVIDPEVNTIVHP